MSMMLTFVNGLLRESNKLNSAEHHSLVRIGQNAYITSQGIPVFCLSGHGPYSYPLSLSALDEQCADYTYSSTGQAAMVKDVLSELGLYSYQKPTVLFDNLIANLRSKNYVLLLQE